MFLCFCAAHPLLSKRRAYAAVVVFCVAVALADDGGCRAVASRIDGLFIFVFHEACCNASGTTPSPCSLVYPSGDLVFHAPICILTMFLTFPPGSTLPRPLVLFYFHGGVDGAEFSVAWSIVALSLVHFRMYLPSHHLFSFASSFGFECSKAAFSGVQRTRSTIVA